MIRLWLVFGIVAVLIHFAITVWRNATGKERWNLTKSIGYSIIVSVLAVAALTLFVVLF